MKLFDLDSLPPQDRLMLRLYDVNAAYEAILSEAPTVQRLESFCGAIRYALFEFSASSRRTPGRFTASARALMTIADQVIKVGQAARPRRAPDPKWTLVLTSIGNHRRQFEAALEASLAAEKKQARDWREATKRVTLPPMIWFGSSHTQATRRLAAAV